MCPRRPASLIPSLAFHAFSSCLQQNVQIRPFSFNNFQDAPPATLFLSKICIVAGGWVGEQRSALLNALLLCPFCPSPIALFSTSSELPNLQPVCFDNDMNCPGRGWGRVLTFRRSNFRAFRPSATVRPIARSQAWCKNWHRTPSATKQSRFLRCLREGERTAGPAARSWDPAGGRSLVGM